MKEVAFLCGLLSGLCGVASAIAFLKGSKAMPWDMQTWSGQTEFEKTFRASADRWNKAGIVCLLAAFVLSAAAALASYYI